MPVQIDGTGTITGLLSLSLPLTGVLKGTGTGNNIAVATAGTDYLAPPAGTAILKANSGGALANATAGTDYVTPTGTETLTNKTLTAPTITDYTETVYAPAAGSSFTVSLSNGTIQKLTTNANTTITLPASVAGKNYSIIVAYGGVHTLTWSGGTTIKWAGGTAPTATSVNGKFDIFVFTCDGTNTYGRSGGSNF